MVVTHWPQPCRFTRAPYVEKLRREFRVPVQGAVGSPAPAPTMMAPESGSPRGNGCSYAGSSVSTPLLPAASTTMIPSCVASLIASYTAGQYSLGT